MRVFKVDPLQCIKIAVDRFLKRTSSFERFLKHVFLSDRLLIGFQEKKRALKLRSIETIRLHCINKSAWSGLNGSAYAYY